MSLSGGDNKCAHGGQSSSYWQSSESKGILVILILASLFKVLPEDSEHFFFFFLPSSTWNTCHQWWLASFDRRINLGWANMEAPWQIWKLLTIVLWIWELWRVCLMYSNKLEFASKKANLICKTSNDVYIWSIQTLRHTTTPVNWNSYQLDTSIHLSSFGLNHCKKNS